MSIESFVQQYGERLMLVSDEKNEPTGCCELDNSAFAFKWYIVHGMYFIHRQFILDDDCRYKYECCLTTLQTSPDFEYYSKNKHRKLDFLKYADETTNSEELIMYKNPDGSMRNISMIKNKIQEWYDYVRYETDNDYWYDDWKCFMVLQDCEEPIAWFININPKSMLYKYVCIFETENFSDICVYLRTIDEFLQNPMENVPEHFDNVNNVVDVNAN